MLQFQTSVLGSLVFLRITVASTIGSLCYPPGTINMVLHIFQWGHYGFQSQHCFWPLVQAHGSTHESNKRDHAGATKIALINAKIFLVISGGATALHKESVHDQRQTSTTMKLPSVTGTGSMNQGQLGAKLPSFSTQVAQAMVAKRPAANSAAAEAEQNTAEAENKEGQTVGEDQKAEEKKEAKNSEKNKASPKAKAKAKSKAKSKAKATPKKTTKPKPKETSKKRKKTTEKTAGEEKQEEQKEPKGKANKQTMKEKTATWRKPLEVKQEEGEGSEGEEEEQKEADPEVSPAETRDAAKARKFAKMLKSGQLPEEIQLMYNEAAQKSSSPRLFRTEMINRLFQRNNKGEWVMASASPQFQSWKQSQDKKFSTAKSVGTGPMIMLWQTFHGNKEAMEEAARVGDIFEQNGLWYFKQMETGRTKELTDKMELSGGAAQLSVDEYSDMSGWLQSRPWSKYGQHLPELGNSLASLCWGH